MQSLNGTNVFVTGHTGFKGAWLCLVLEQLGAHVTGFALAPATTPNLFDLTGLGERIRHVEGDVRDLDALRAAVHAANPEIIIHLAAQAIVLTGYEQPVLTFETNVVGTLNLLETVRSLDSIRALVNVTSDKCYENQEWVWAYRENDRLGGRDPYAASKACSELVMNAYCDSYLRHKGAMRVGVASARAGNVIGGGDWADHRIVPDCVRAIAASSPIELRNPEATRPWQHVLEPVVAYLRLACALRDEPDRYSGSWNFGPAESGETVGQLAASLVQSWDSPVQILSDDSQRGSAATEAQALRLSSEKARTELGWRPQWGFDATVLRTATWYRQVEHDPTLALASCLEQIKEYLGSTPSSA